MGLRINQNPDALLASGAAAGVAAGVKLRIPHGISLQKLRCRGSPGQFEVSMHPLRAFSLLQRQGTSGQIKKIIKRMNKNDRFAADWIVIGSQIV